MAQPLSQDFNRSKTFQSPSVETEVRKFLDGYLEAYRGGNLDDILALYDADTTAFDMMPPLRFQGLSKYEGAVEKCFTSYFSFPIRYEFVDQKIIADSDVAFCHGLTWMSGRSKKGEVMECWVRNTLGLKKINDEWKIVHSHDSVPLALEDAKGMLTLRPEDDKKFTY